MRKLVLVVAACLVAIGLAAPTAEAATAPVNPKVVLIVGPVGGSTSSYKSDADAAAAEAAKYTTNVIKVYSPKATWSAARAALQGASIVVYMGHGNGWPSPYPPFQEDTKDGLGLNPTAGTDNTSTKYYGANYLASYVDLAPNAVVFLGHLCYSAGNSEPGNADVSLSDAKKRVDNMAAGWIKSGARAVIAEPYTSGMYGGAAWWIRQLFTTHQAVDNAWLHSPSFNNHVLSFPSVRSSGFTAKMDPGKVNAPPYKRSIVEKTTLLTQDVTGARYAATDADPTSFVVPGAASVRTDGRPLYPSQADATAAMNGAPQQLDTRVRLDGPAVSINGLSAYPVHRLDGAGSGFMFAADLRPRDSQGPAVWTADTGAGAFSPNADGSQDTIAVSGQMSEAATWRVSFQRVDGTELAAVASASPSNSYEATWNGRPGGSAVADGAYKFVVTATDAWGNPTGTRSGSITVDTVAPALAPVTVAAAAVRTFSPNGDGVADSIGFAYGTNEPGFIDLTVKNSSGTAIRHEAASTAAGSGSATWLGDTDAGGTAPDGTYVVAMAPRDLAGNRGGSRTESVDVYTPIKSVRSSTSGFFPQDGDAYSKTVTFSFVLARAATVTWTITDATGAVVATRMNARALTSLTTYSWSWNGRNASNVYVPRGRYYSTVTATNGTRTLVQKSWVQADAFRLTPSDTTPGRGQTITLTAVTAESLRTLPTVHVYEPGHAMVTITMSRITSTTYRATIHLYATGTAGTLDLRVYGHDAANGINSSRLLLPLH